MKMLRRYWALLLAGSLVPLLLFLAFLQLKWIEEMGERERFRLAQGLFSTANQLSTAMQNEIAVIPALFEMDTKEMYSTLESDDWEAFKGRWELWKAYALAPDIVAGLYVFYAPDETEGHALLYRWNETTFAPAEEAPLSDSLARILDAAPRDPAFLAPAELVDGSEVFMIPLRPSRQLGRGWFVIRVNREALTQRLIPLLAEQYLVGKTDYYFRVVDRQDGTVVYTSAPGLSDAVFLKTDLQYPLLRADFRVSVDRSAAGEGGSAYGAPPALTLLRIRREIISTQPDPDRRLEFNRARLEGARWVLEAVHRSGSLAAAVHAATVRNILVSFGILALLSTALVVLSIAVRRKEELTERQREFIASVTHELKTPVAVIRSAADNLASGIIRDAAKTAAYGVAIRDQGRRLSDMIDRLLVYARIGDGRPQLEASLSLREVCERVLQEYGGELAAAQFRLEAPFKQDARVRGDAAALELAFGNLVANALKHGREGGFLGLDLRTEGGKWALVSFRDHGPGVKRQERKLIFEAFYRGERARSDQTSGSGLGLNLVRRIVAAHGGTVRYEALGDLGAQFIVRLPLEAANV